MASTKNRKLALYGLLTALALILSYVEGQIPAFFAVPGMKLGLTNIVVLLALYCMGAKSALAVNFVRIVLVSILFGNGVSFWYSLAGGLLSGAVMIALKKCGRFSDMTKSWSGQPDHGQIRGENNDEKEIIKPGALCRAGPRAGRLWKQSGSGRGHLTADHHRQ